MSRTGAHAFLYQQCRDLHDRLDSHPVLRSLGGQEAELAGYGQALAALQQCLVPAEAALASFESAMPALFPTRYVPRSAWLSQDLQALGLSTRSAPPSAPLDPLPTRAAYLGYRYVLEGAALGSAWVLQRLLKQHPRFDPGSRQYLQAQEVQAREWPDFITQFNQSLADPEQQQEACLAARKLFRYFCATLDTCTQNP